MVKKGLAKSPTQVPGLCSPEPCVVEVRDSQGVLPPGGSGLVSDGHHRGTLSPHVPVQSWSIEEALQVTTSADKMEVKVLPQWLRAVLEFSLITPQYGQKASCLHLPPMVNDCLMRHPCQWKFDNRNSLSMPTWHSRGTTAVNRGTHVLAKEDRAMGRYLSKPSRVYRGTQSAVAVNWSREHSTRRPSSRRIGSQWLVITSGKSDCNAAARGMKCSKVLISFLEGVVPGSNPRRLHLMCWTQPLSAAKVSYLLGRMSSSVTPLGRTASWGGMLLSSSVAHFFGGDMHGLQSSSGHVEAAWGISVGRSASSSSDITTAASSSGSGSRRV